MKKLYLFFLLSIVVFTTTAQQVDMETVPVAGKLFKNPILIGKVGSHYMVMDELGKWPTFIYTFDSSFKLANTTEEYITSPGINFTISGNTVNIIWKSWRRDTLSVSTVKLDENGNRVWFNDNKFYFPHNAASTPLLVTDVNNRYFLYYSLSEDGFNHDNIRAVLMDSLWREVKTIFQRFDYDNRQFTISSPLVDVSGNIYMAVFDKLSNYHLAATVGIHRFPLTKDTVTTTNFQFEKTKFHELEFKEDTAVKFIKLTGFYYDGQLKNKTGIAELAFSGQGKELAASHFYEFPPTLADELRKNLVYGRKKDDPTDNLHLKDVFKNEGSLFVSAWLVDLPNYMVMKEKDIDKEDPEEQKKQKKSSSSSATQLTNPSLDGWLNNSRNFNSTTSLPPAADPRNPNIFQPQGTTPVYTSPVGQPMRSTTPSSVHFIEENSKQEQAFRLYTQSLSSRYLVYFSIDAKGQYSYQVIPNNRFLWPSTINLNNHPLVYKGQLFFLNNNAQTNDALKKLPVTKTVSVLKYGKLAQPNPLASFGIENFYMISKPAEIAQGMYLSVFRKSSLTESGLVVWKIHEKEKQDLAGQ